MPRYSQPIQSLMSFRKPALVDNLPPEGHPNAPAAAYDFQKAMNDELEARIGEAKGMGDKFNFERLSALLRPGQRYLDDSPITQQQARYDDYQDQQHSATMEGFDYADGSLPSAKKAHFERQLRQQVANNPTQVANIEQSGERARNLDTIGGDRELLRQRQAGDVDILERSQQHSLDLADRYADSGSGRFYTGTDSKGNPKFSRVPQANVSGLMNRLGSTRDALRGRDPFDTPDDPVSKSFLQDLTNLVSQYNVGDDAKEDFWKIMRDPRLRKLDIDSLVDRQVDDPEYVSELEELLNLGRLPNIQQQY